MSGDVVLSAALRNNLLSLQNTQRSIDTTQLRLATGLRVNSALDNPSNFFTAQALNNRASDLNGLLDGINQSIRAIEAADNGITAVTSLIEQAQSIAQSAQDELRAGSGEASVTSSGTNLIGSDDLIGDFGFGDGDQFRITVGDTADSADNLVTINTGDGIDALLSNINSIENVSASLTSEGNLSIRTTNGQTLTLTETLNNPLAALNIDVGSFAPGNELESVLTNPDGTVATRYQALSSLDGFGTSGSFTIGLLSITSTGTTTVSTSAIALSATIDAFVDGLNGIAGVSATFDESTGELEIDTSGLSNTNASTTALQFNAGGAVQVDFDFNGDLVDTTFAAGAGTINFFAGGGANTDTLQQLATDFAEVRNQIDGIVEDASYRGINLLENDDLLTTFNEFRTTDLTTEGVNFTANGLGINAATFEDIAATETTLTEVRTALESVRTFGSTIANDLAIIQTRRDFTESTVNTLESGADDLTVADQNEEGANLLALQTRQQLGVTSLSLASQSQQSVLRLF